MTVLFLLDNDKPVHNKYTFFPLNHLKEKINSNVSAQMNHSIDDVLFLDLICL